MPRGHGTAWTLRHGHEGGECIASLELENLLVGHPAVREAAVVGLQDPRWDERPLAVVVPEPGAAPDPESLRAFLRPHVAKWWIPERFRFVDAIPKTSVGKIDKQALRRQLAEA